MGISIGSYDVPNATAAMKKATLINPKMIEAYDYLGSLSFRIFKLAECRDYQKKAYEVDTTSPQRLYRYAIAEMDVNKLNGRKLLREIAERFLKHDYAIFALGTLAESFDDEKKSQNPRRN